MQGLSCGFVVPVQFDLQHYQKRTSLSALKSKNTYIITTQPDEAGI